MKVSLILKIVGALHIAVGGMLIYLLLFAHEMLMESMGGRCFLKNFQNCAINSGCSWCIKRRNRAFADIL